MRQWTRTQPIRTAAELRVDFSLVETRPPFAYQDIAKDAVRWKKLGMSDTAIARILGVTDKTVAKSIRRSER
jgi:transposase-like protein